MAPERQQIQPGRRSRHSLHRSLRGWLMGVALIPLIAAGTIGYTSAYRSQHRDIASAVEGAAAAGKEAVHSFFDRASRELERQSRLQVNAELVAQLNADLAASGRSPRSWVDSPSWDGIAGSVGRELVRYRNGSPWFDVLIVNRDGVVVFSCRREDDLGSNLVSGPYSRSSLASAVREAVSSGRMVLSPFAAYEPSAGLASAFLAVPMTGPDGAGTGVMAFQFDGLAIDNVVRQGLPAESSARLYLVDESLCLLSQGGPGADLARLRDRILTDGSAAWLKRQKAVYDDTLAESAVSGASARLDGDVIRYRAAGAQQVFGTSETIDVVGRRFGLIAELPADEALAGLRQIKLAMLLIIVLTGLAAAAVGQAIAHRVVQPILALGHLMNRVADGHEVTDLNVVGRNEVGDLAESFSKMIGHLDEAKRTRDRQFHLQRSQAELNERMRGEPDSETLAAAILEHIGEYYRAQAGAFYLARPGQSLVLVAHFGESDKHWPLRRLREGQGVVGRAAMRRRIQLMRDIPADHLVVRSAMGESTPRTLVVAPFHLAGQVKGVMELATFADLAEEDLEFLRLTAESVAVALDSSRSRERVHRLLEETRRQAGALSRQQKELQEKNERLARSDRYKSEFLANMSHELRTPLNSMMLMAQVLGENRGARLDRSEVEAACTIHQAGDELLTIIDDILDLSKVEAGKLELHPDAVEIGSLVTELRQLFRPVADGKDIEFRTNVEPGVPATMVTDELRLKQVLKNLLGNACKFTEAGSVVLRAWVPSLQEVAELDGWAGGSCVAFSVADTGIGMSEDVRQQVFEAFNQGDGTIGRRYGGSGLGLSISRRLTELLHGRLDVSSVEGKGTRFTLYLPQLVDLTADEGPVPEASGDDWIAPQGPITEPDAALEATCLAGWRVILADDEMRTIYRLGDELTAAGCEPEVVRRLSDLFGIVAGLASPTLLLVNPWCGGGGPAGSRGDDLLRQLRERSGTDQLRLVALVGAGRRDEITAADEVIVKPAAISQVLAACRAIPQPEEVTS